MYSRTNTVLSELQKGLETAEPAAFVRQLQKKELAHIKRECKAPRETEFFLQNSVSLAL